MSSWRRASTARPSTSPPHHPETLAWQNAQTLGVDVVASLRSIKAAEGPHLVVQGSSELLQLLLANELKSV
jgi:hypothetical protein